MSERSNARYTPAAGGLGARSGAGGGIGSIMLVAHGFPGCFSAAQTRVGRGRGQRSARQERSRDSTVASKHTNKLEWSDLDERTVNLIRGLAMDAVGNEG